MSGRKSTRSTTALLGFFEPMECLMLSKLPEGADWSYEIKLDGYRAQAVCQASGTQLLSRNGKDLGKRFPAVVNALAQAIPRGSIVDGELVALDAEGKPSFSLLQNSAISGATFVFFAFDLLALAGTDLTRKPLSERQARLSKTIHQEDTVQLSQGFQISGSGANTGGFSRSPLHAETCSGVLVGGRCANAPARVSRKIRRMLTSNGS